MSSANVSIRSGDPTTFSSFAQLVMSLPAARRGGPGHRELARSLDGVGREIRVDPRDSLVQSVDQHDVRPELALCTRSFGREITAMDVRPPSIGQALKRWLLDERILACRRSHGLAPASCVTP